MGAAPSSEVRPSAAEIRTHLDGIFESPQFRSSKRCHDVLAFLVNKVLEGRSDILKERVIGVEVFGRPPDYNPASDPIVRGSVAEVRKRLAQYYQETLPGEGGPRIKIATGHYVPEFSWDAGAPVEAVPAKKPRRQYLIWVAMAITGALLPVSWWVFHPATALELFWGPAFHSRRAPLILSERYGPASLIHRFNSELRKSGAEPQASARILASDMTTTFGGTIMSGNVFVVRSLDRLFSSNGQDPELRLGGELSTADLTERPVVLIGYFNNPWASNVNSEQPRFTLANERRGEEFVHIIRDREDTARQWSISSDRPWFENTPVSYAIVTRIYDRHSGRFLVSIAGMTHLGTSAAGEFITRPAYLRDLQTKAPSGWEKMNLQAVIQTNIVNQTAAPPKLLAVYFW